MEDILKNKLFVVAAAFFAFNMMIFVGGKFVVNKAADEVIERLERNYSPSPYGPGLDPDRVSPQVLQSTKTYLELKAKPIEGEPMPTAFMESNSTLQVAEASEWLDQWEKDRGFTQ